MNLRHPFVVANWKMHKTRAEALSFVHEFKQALPAPPALEIAIAPSFPLLESVAQALEGSRIKLVAQNMHFAKEGAFTGEVSPNLLYELGVTYVILGHSERRGHFRETDGLINQKIHAAFEFDLVPILCVGETLEERQRGQKETERVLERQLSSDLKDLIPSSVDSLVIAYEPVWAIGTGVHASPADAEAGAAFIRRSIARWFNEITASSVRILYGGSVKPDNAPELLALPNIDGALVGGASLDPKAFAEIAQAVPNR